MDDTKISQNGKRAILYARVSTSEQAEKTSLKTQLDACRVYAESRGFTVVSELQEDVSGAVLIADRPQGSELYKMIDSGKAQAVVCYCLDRLSRDARALDYQFFKAHLIECGAQLHFVDSGPDADDMAGNLVGYVRALAAGDERRKIAKRTKDGRDGKAREGKVLGHGHPPFGYSFEYQFDTSGKRRTVGLEINPTESPIVIDIFTRYAVNGESVYSICKDLSARHVPTSGERRGVTSRRKRGAGIWDEKNVYDILGNSTYVGTLYYGAEKIPVTVPGIVSQELWEMTQQRRKQNRKTSRRKLEYLVSGRILCGCGRHMVGCQSKGIPYYRCSSYSHKFAEIEGRGCIEGSVQVKRVDVIAWDFALYAKRSYAEFKTMLEERQEQQRQGLSPVQQRMELVERQLSEVNNKMRRIADLLVDSDLAQDTKSLFKQNLVIATQQRENIVQEREELAKRIIEIEDTTLGDDDIITVLQTRESAIAKLQDASFDEKRRYIEHIGLTVTIKNGIAHLASKFPVSNKDVSEIPVKLIGRSRPQTDSCTTCPLAYRPSAASSA